jgi:hypothetical protein
VARGVSDRLRLISHFPGRLRVRADAFLQPELRDAVVRQLGDEPGVISITPSRRTGSLVIVYQPSAIQLPQLVQVVVRLGGLTGLAVDARPEVADQSQGQRLRALLDKVNRALRGSSRDLVDLRAMVPSTLALAGVGKLLFGRRTIPEWYDLLFWSFVTFVNLNPPGHTDGDAPP